MTPAPDAARVEARLDELLTQHAQGCGCKPGDFCEWFGVSTIRELKALVVRERSEPSSPSVPSAEAVAKAKVLVNNVLTLVESLTRKKILFPAGLVHTDSLTVKPCHEVIEDYMALALDAFASERAEGASATLPKCFVCQKEITNAACAEHTGAAVNVDRLIATTEELADARAAIREAKGLLPTSVSDKSNSQWSREISAWLALPAVLSAATPPEERP